MFVAPEGVDGAAVAGAVSCSWVEHWAAGDAKAKQEAIAAMRTFVELLQGPAGLDPAARAEFLDSSAVQLDRLDWLAQNLLELSKPQHQPFTQASKRTAAIGPAHNPVVEQAIEALAKIGVRRAG